MKPKARDAQKNAWISETTWRIVDERVSARRDPAQYQALIWGLCRAIAARLNGDQRQRAEEAGDEVERLLGSDTPLHCEAWNKMQGWYQSAVERAIPPTRVTLEQITTERVYLYSYVPSSGENIPVSVEPFQVYDLVPTEDDIEWAVKRLRNHCYRGTSGMRAEHIKEWLVEARKKKR